ncbi:MAG TPA: alpha/beta fold hydrolase [Longimicrobiales bacterium]
MRSNPVLKLCLALALVPAPLSAQSSSTVVVEVPAPALAGNRVGTPTTQSAAIYLPAGYERETTRRYPVVYLLHGIFDSHETWTDHFEVPALLDRLIAAGDLPAVIVVMPNGGNRYGGGYYVDSPTTGGWSTFVARDLVAFVDARYRTRARSDARAIVGHSMGGFGAIHVPMEHPGVFGVAYAISPCCLAPVEDVGFGNVAWRTAFGWDAIADYERALETQDFYPVAALGILSAMSPDTSASAAPFFVDFPFAMTRGEVVVDEAEWLAYVERFPVARADDRRAALASLRALGMDYGTGDQFLHIPAATLAFSQRLGELRVPHLLDVYDGDHRDRVAERLESFVLPWVGRALAE